MKQITNVLYMALALAIYGYICYLLINFLIGVLT